ncbi:PEP-CTERM sorting domain-containing protein [Roseateles oligotrophus]|uniref:PEP-CTERM sorting domain-containing protein n=1 Tax=Roseateles oligotrophus TaxID=1769250 RepID=A0ABT2YGH2_9BURK|nr:PEP-CTERM sorting domain-containing protein [Roseateles oligotrophus]MCV2369144.1 PEP-CTERM sorting domain-containing protein [Roseateles oligotrophus]
MKLQSKRSLLTAAMVLGLGVAAVQSAQALTIVLDFVPGATTDINGVGTLSESFASWGFTGLDLAGVRAATLTAVNKDYLQYPTFGSNALSPLPNGKELNINFSLSNGLTGPGNGDSEWYYMAIGDANPNQGFLGQACLSCVRNSSGVASVANGSIFGSTLTDSISGLLGLASNDTQRINLLAGTVAHEIGHSLTLLHPTSALANPGDSLYSVMATGASPTSMPNAERVKDRAFAYSEFSSLIQSVGLRNVSAVPEPSSYLMLALGLAVLALRSRKAGQAR